MIELTMTPESISFDISEVVPASAVVEIDRAVAFLEQQRSHYIHTHLVKNGFPPEDIMRGVPPKNIDKPLRVNPDAYSIRVKREGRIGCLPVPSKTYLHCPDGEVPLAEYLNRVLNEFPELNGYLDVVKGGTGDLYCFEFTSSNGIQCLIEPGMWITIHGHEFEIHR